MRVNTVLMTGVVVAVCGLAPSKASAQCHYPIYPSAGYVVVYDYHPRYRPHAHVFHHHDHGHSHWYHDDDHGRRHHRGHKDDFRRRRWRDYD